MTNNLRSLSSRPELVVDNASNRVRDPATTTTPGIPAPLSRNRVVSALPLLNGPVQIVQPSFFVSPDGTFLADPSNNLLGAPGIKVDRLLTVRHNPDTRRL